MYVSLPYHFHFCHSDTLRKLRKLWSIGSQPSPIADMRLSVDWITLRVHGVGKKSRGNIFHCDHLNLGVKMTTWTMAFRIYPI